MRILLVIYIIATILPLKVAAQYATLKGLVKDNKNEKLPFASVYIKDLNLSTTTNEEGVFQLKVPEGTHEITCQYIGYKKQQKNIHTKQGEILEVNFILEVEHYDLAEVQINATAEDPAYPIMRQAIARRKVYQFEAKEYSCRVYLKGLQRLTKVPERVMLMKVPEDVKPGIVYLSESLSDLQVQLPDKVKEKLISSKVSGDNRAFSFNRAGSLKFSLYEPLINAYNLSPRGFISPLSNQAFGTYQFKLEGEIKENNQTIYKIKLIPKRKHDPAFKGHIYIMKDSWRIHSTDLLVDKNSGVEFVDTLYIKQQYAPQAGGVWMPVSQRFIFYLEILGFRGNGYFVSSHSNYKVLSNYPTSFYRGETQAIVENKPTPQVKKVAKLKMKPANVKKDSSMFSQKHFTNEVMLVDKQANKTPDSIWEAVRPVPLTEEELSDYHEKDSIQQVHESKPYLDSIDKINNKPDWLTVLFSGYDYANSYKKRYFSFDPLPVTFQYNTVEGFVLNPRLSFTQTFEDNTEYSLTGQMRYGFASKRFYGKAHTSWTFDPIKESRIGIEAGNFVEQFNAQNPITPFINSVYTLIGEANYMKLYEKAYIKGSFNSEIFNGVKLYSKMEYAYRSNLFNNTYYSFFGDKENRFTPNQPANNTIGGTGFKTHQVLLFDVSFQFIFAQQYVSRPDMKINFVRRNRYPILYFSYRKGIPTAPNSPNFDEVNISARYSMDLGLLGKSNLRSGGGIFLNNKQVYMMDLHHFGGNRTILAFDDFRSYQLLDYYQFSTNQWYVQGFFNHHFNGFFINKIPLIRKLKWQEVVTLNYLKTPNLNHYIEWGAGIEHIFKFMRVNYYQSFEEGKYRMQGIRIGLGF